MSTIFPSDAIRQIATAIGTPADVDPLDDLPGLVMAVQGVAQRAESSAIVVADAVAAERMAAGAWLRNPANWGQQNIASAIEHGDHIDDDAPPLPSLRLTLAARRMLLEQVTAADDELKALRAERDRRIDPVEHARAVRAAFLAGFDRAPGDYFAAAPWERDPETQWANADDRDDLLARVGADVLAAVEVKP